MELEKCLQIVYTSKSLKPIKMPSKVKRIGAFGALHKSCAMRRCFLCSKGFTAKGGRS